MKFDQLFYRFGAVLAVILATHSARTALTPNAFPRAEGFGAYAQGGRGGQVLFVTNLLDYKEKENPIPGSLRAAVEAKGPRTIIFRVSGLIPLKSPLKVKNPYLTIAGQTAPGAGICLKDFQLMISDTHDVIVRHLRVRPGENQHEEIDGVIIEGSENVIVDHCSVSWSTDEVFSPDGKNITVQWCIISEGLDRSFHPKGKHSKGSIIRSTDGGITLHHNIYAHNADRNPKMESYPNLPGLLLDFRNNIIYDWGYQAGYSGRDYGRLNYLGNYLKPGPSSERGVRFAFKPGGDRTKVYIRDNVMAGDAVASQKNDLLLKWDGKSLDEVRVGRPFPAPSVTTQPVSEMQALVLAQAGATLPRRDAVDARIVAGVERGAGRIIDSQNDVGGWPEYPSSSALTDADEDGMPDEWEAAHGLNPQKPDHNLDSDGDGYTNLEEFLNATNPQQRDASGDREDFLRAQKQLAELNAQATPQIGRVATQEKKVAAERQPLTVPVNLSAVPAQAGPRLEVAISNTLAMPMVLIPAGTFVMGTPETETYRKADEVQHKVTITKPFYLAVYTVTRRQFAAAMQQKMPSGANGDLPQTVPWGEAEWFCKNLSHSTGQKFRLATEAEWEYACRAGTTTPFSTGETISTTQANFNGDRIYGRGQKGIYRDNLTPPGTFPPNAWGVADMHGNFFEWCSDWRAPYPSGDQIDPQGPRTGKRRVMRGGNFSSHPAYLRSGARYDYDPKVDYAFRVVLELPKSK